MTPWDDTDSQCKRRASTQYQERQTVHIHHVEETPLVNTRRTSTIWVRLTVVVSSHKGDNVKGCTKHTASMKKLVRMAPNVKRTRAQPLRDSTDEQDHSKQERQSFG